MTNQHTSNKWLKVKLKDVCREITVGHVGPMADQYIDDGIPFLRSQNVRPFRFNPSGLCHISSAFHAKLKKSALQPGDVVVTRTGANTGQCCVIPKTLQRANCADLVIFRPSDQIDSHFLMYLLNSSWGRATISGGVVGAAQHHFNIGVAKEVLVHLPNVSTQRNIAGILSAYDDLIENNTRRVAILEAMAQAIYREWFVEFRFPGHEKGKLVDSTLGKIPEGWNVASVQTFLPQSTSGIAPTSFPDEEFAHYSIPNYDKGKLPVLEMGKTIHSNKFPVPEGCVLLSKLNPRIPRIWLPILDSAYRPIASTEFLVITALPPATREFAYCLLHAEDFYSRFCSCSSGTSTSHQRVKPTDFAKLEAVLPQKGLIDQFSIHVASILRLAHNRMLHSRNLRNTRDLLLPKLISGQLDVEDLDIDTGEAVTE